MCSSDLRGSQEAARRQSGGSRGQPGGSREAARRQPRGSREAAVGAAGSTGSSREAAGGRRDANREAAGTQPGGSWEAAGRQLCVEALRVSRAPRRRGAQAANPVERRDAKLDVSTARDIDIACPDHPVLHAGARCAKIERRGEIHLKRIARFRRRIEGCRKGQNPRGCGIGADESVLDRLSLPLDELDGTSRHFSKRPQLAFSANPRREQLLAGEPGCRGKLHRTAQQIL